MGGTLGCQTPPSSPISPFWQRSLEDEINRTTGEDIPVFAVSYLVVFAYIALALGEYTAWRRVLVRTWGGGYGVTPAPMGAPPGAERVVRVPPLPVFPTGCRWSRR